MAFLVRLVFVTGGALPVVSGHAVDPHHATWIGWRAAQCGPGSVPLADIGAKTTHLSGFHGKVAPVTDGPTP
jgi:hypothetical protein